MENKKKYYFLVNSLEGGGAERVILRVADNLSKSATIHIITLKNESFYDLPEGVIWKPLSNIHSNLLMFLMVPYFAIKLRHLIQKEGYTNGMSFLEISNFVHILARKNAIISLRVNLDYFKRAAGYVYLMIIKLLYKKAGKIVVNSYENAGELQRDFGLSDDKVVTIHNPIDNAFIEKSLQVNIDLPGSQDGKIKFITIGRIVWQKHHEDIILALSELKKKGINNFIYYIIGDGNKKELLEELVEKENLSSEVYFLGSQKNVFAYLKNCDYFLYASEAEGFPNVLLEAIAVGIPIITTDFKTGAREVMYGFYNKDIKLPQICPNGALLRSRKFQEDFIAIYDKINTVKQNKVGLEGYELGKISQSFREVLDAENI